MRCGNAADKVENTIDSHAVHLADMGREITSANPAQERVAGCGVGSATPALLGEGAPGDEISCELGAPLRRSQLESDMD